MKIMEPLPISARDLVHHIKQYEPWIDRASLGFGLRQVMTKDIESLTSKDEGDLKPIAVFLAESAKERMSVPGGKWSWRRRNSLGGYKSPYLDWLKEQWAIGRWKDDETIHPDERKVLDPRFARYGSMMYWPGKQNLLGREWTDVVQGYRDFCGQEARRCMAIHENLAPGEMTKKAVEAHLLTHFGKQGWDCHSVKTVVGNILIAQKASLDDGYAFRIDMSVADRSLLSSIECHISVIPVDVALNVVGGGPSALVASPVNGLMFPFGSAYLQHSGERARLANAIAFVGSVVGAMTKPEQAA